jgi:photosystem II stability/assembly factor-like uncharacterized protein
MRSDDGGKKWTPQGPEVNSVCFTSEDRGWAAGPHEVGAALFRTEDAGANWTEIPLPMPGADITGWQATVRCAGIDAWVLLQEGGAAGHQAYALIRTVEGGPSTEPILQEAGTHPLGQVEGVVNVQDPYPGPFVAFDGVSALFIGWCPSCGNSVSLYESASGWSRAELVKEGATPLGMSFADRERGWILLQEGPKEPGAVMATTDGGRTWNTLG